MKREFPSSLYPVTPSANSHLASWTYETAIDNSDDCFKQSDVSREENDSVNSNDSGSGRQRKARTSAAVIGLAISMGASNLMVARHQGVAAAAEPLATEAKAVEELSSLVNVTSLSEVAPSDGVSSFPTPEFSGIRYTVQEGDTFWGISQIYGVDPDEIASINHLEVDSVLNVGQSLQIPSATESSLESKQEINLVRLNHHRQELLSSLSQLKSLGNSSLKLVAPELGSVSHSQETGSSLLSKTISDTHGKVASIGLGEIVNTPFIPQAEESNIYRVRQGDTVDSIARKHGLTRLDVLAVNQISDPNWIYIGQKIVIPQPKLASKNLVSLPAEVKLASSNSYVEQYLSTAAPQVTLKDDEASTAEDPLVKPDVKVALTPPTFDYNESSQASTSESSQFSPYLQRLRQDISRLQDRYQPIHTLSPSGTSAKVVKSISPASTLGNQPVKQAVNPEFAASLRSISLSQFDRLSSINSSGKTGLTSNKPFLGSASQLVAATPTESSSYETLMQSTLGRVVSPELPSLSSPDRYLPDASIFKGYIWPTKGSLTSGFGWRWGRMHRGIDIAGPVGTPIVAAAEGVVVTSGWNSGGYGNLVEIRHADGSLTLYAHNQRILVEEGQRVTQGQLIAEMGSTGFSTGPHLHFEIHPAGQGAVNPITYLAQAKR
ncbi:MAG: peptidoglycan DD-metalloendopeptidase family protein [Synechococcales bacterium]|nr:peptidoglycan DD-metalloendopeptidase family protein [Synechococcales bacterium]